MIQNSNLNDIRCVSCGSTRILLSEDAPNSCFCPTCKFSFQSIWGVPFFGQYEGEDLLGLIEIAANANNRGKFRVTPSSVEEWETLLLAYDQAADKEAFVNNTPSAQSPYLLNRYGEWQEIARLTRDLNLHGSKVLDMGAGLGFDSHRLSMRGAKVTALEFSPLLAESGQLNFPEIRWVGGLSHYLPFQNASFDAVFCNAALHHMRDIPSTISEALRVLRPGGVLITTCDSFRPSNSKDEVELDIFDNEPAVLLGVNEGVPKFSDFVSTLEKHLDLLDVELYTHMLYNAPAGGDLSELTLWRWDKDRDMLSKRSGSLAMRIRLKSSWPEPARLQKQGVITASEYVSTLSSATHALSKLAPLIPTQYVDIPFPGRTSSKFQLLNGWRLPKSFHQSRAAYARGRWFLKRSSLQDTLIFDLGLSANGLSRVESVTVLVNGEQQGIFPVCVSQWCPVKLNLLHIPSEQVFAVEMQQNGAGDGLDEAAFLVRNRRFIATQNLKYSESSSGSHICENPRVYVVIPVYNRVHFTLECIGYLKAQNYPSIEIVVADGGSSDDTVETVRTQHPDVMVLTSDTELWWAGAMAKGIDYALKMSQDADDCVLMMNNDTQIPCDYVDKLVQAALIYDAAVGALVVDSRDTNHILDAGEYIDWSNYAFPVKTVIDVDEVFCDDVDVLPGRGSLIPLKMIRSAGNVDAQLLPHYLADYEFFCRLKQHGFRLGVCYETRILAHIEETGIVPTDEVSGFRAIWREAFSRRSMSNVVDHWRFASRHAPEQFRAAICRRLIRRVIADLTLRTPVRPFFLPVYWLLSLPGRLFAIIRGQRRAFALFRKAINEKGMDVLCNPQNFPGFIRLPLYFAAAPGPLRHAEIIKAGLSIDQLLEQKILRRLSVDSWYAFATLQFANRPDSATLTRLFWAAWNPLNKWTNTLTWPKQTREIAET